jgi:hypothetical protein
LIVTVDQGQLLRACPGYLLLRLQRAHLIFITGLQLMRGNLGLRLTRDASFR